MSYPSHLLPSFLTFSARHVISHSTRSPSYFQRGHREGSMGNLCPIARAHWRGRTLRSKSTRAVSAASLGLGALNAKLYFHLREVTPIKVIGYFRLSMSQRQPQNQVSPHALTVFTLQRTTSRPRWRWILTPPSVALIWVRRAVFRA